MKLRLLKENEIDVRIGTINDKGATLLLYKDARVDMNILDESDVKWKRSHELINGNLFCTISIWDDEIKDWITRQDVGVESNTEKEKGQASDAFKRAAFNFGIGRELYTAPFIWISGTAYSAFINPKTGKPSTYDKFSVTKIGYNDNKEINELEIKNLKTSKVVFKLGETVEVPKTKPNETVYSKPNTYQAPDPKGTGQTRTTIPKDLEEPFPSKPSETQLLEARELLENTGYSTELIDGRLKLIKTSQEANELIAKLKEQE